MDIRHGENNKVVLFIFLFEDLKPFLIRLVLLLFPVCIEMDSFSTCRWIVCGSRLLKAAPLLPPLPYVRGIDVWSDAEGDVFRSDIL